MKSLKEFLTEGLFGGSEHKAPNVAADCVYNVSPGEKIYEWIWGAPNWQFTVTVTSIEEGKMRGFGKCRRIHYKHEDDKECYFDVPEQFGSGRTFVMYEGPNKYNPSRTEVFSLDNITEEESKELEYDYAGKKAPRWVLPQRWCHSFMSERDAWKKA